MRLAAALFGLALSGGVARAKPLDALARAGVECVALGAAMEQVMLERYGPGHPEAMHRDRQMWAALRSRTRGRTSDQALAAEQARLMPGLLLAMNAFHDNAALIPGTREDPVAFIGARHEACVALLTEQGLGPRQP